MNTAMIKPGDVQPPVAYSVPQTARLIGLSKGQVYIEINAGRLRSVKVGRRRLIPASAIDKWLASLPAGGRTPRRGR
jgi:excisionase family DNA binding protein